MSGGHFDYQNYKLHEFYERIRRDMEVHPKLFLDKTVLDHCKEMAKKLKRLSDELHDYDYFMSGDYSEETYKKKILGKRRKS